MDIIWKDSPMDPSENLTKLSQYVGAYATTTIVKDYIIQKWNNAKL